MHRYDVYRTKEGKAVAIKHGFCWSAFFFSWIWFAKRKMWLGMSIQILAQTAIITYSIISVLHASNEIAELRSADNLYSYMFYLVILLTCIFVFIFFYPTLVIHIFISMYEAILKNDMDIVGCFFDGIKCFSTFLWVTFPMTVIIMIFILMYSIEFSYGRTIVRRGGELLHKKLLAPSGKSALEYSGADTT